MRVKKYYQFTITVSVLVSVTVRVSLVWFGGIKPAVCIAKMQSTFTRLAVCIASFDNKCYSHCTKFMFP